MTPDWRGCHYVIVGLRFQPNSYTIKPPTIHKNVDTRVGLSLYSSPV